MEEKCRWETICAGLGKLFLGTAAVITAIVGACLSPAISKRLTFSQSQSQSQSMTIKLGEACQQLQKGKSALEHPTTFEEYLTTIPSKPNTDQKGSGIFIDGKYRDELKSEVRSADSREERILIFEKYLNKSFSGYGTLQLKADGHDE